MLYIYDGQKNETHKTIKILNGTIICIYFVKIMVFSFNL